MTWEGSEFYLEEKWRRIPKSLRIPCFKSQIEEIKKIMDNFSIFFIVDHVEGDKEDDSKNGQQCLDVYF